MEGGHLLDQSSRTVLHREEWRVDLDFFESLNVWLRVINLKNIFYWVLQVFWVVGLFPSAHVGHIIAMYQGYRFEKLSLIITAKSLAFYCNG